MTNDTQAMTLTEFLLARIAEDEETARRSKASDAMNPNLRIPAGWVAGVADRVLAECEAKRRIMTLHKPDVRWPEDRNRVGCGCCRLRLDIPAGDEWPCLTIRALAAVYNDHPDYNPDWA